MNPQLVLHRVWQILVEISKRVRILGEALVLRSKAIAGSDLAEAEEVDHVKGTTGGLCMSRRSRKLETWPWTYEMW
jgi:hypothetical protein